MKAIVVTDQAAGTKGMRLAERPTPQAAINDVVVEVHAAGFVNTELTWPSTWADRLGRDRQAAVDPGTSEFVDLDNEALEDVGESTWCST